MSFDYFGSHPGVYQAVCITRAEVAARALAATAGLPTRYKLGMGGRNPGATHPAPMMACDCSGFSAWATGHDRRQFAPGHRLADKVTGEMWYDTRTIVNDAKARTHLIYAVVMRTEEVVPGMLLVYSPDEANLPYGHVGVITKVKDGFVRGRVKPGEEWWRFLEVTDCSTGRGATAIRTRPNARLWSAEKRGGYIVQNIRNVVDGE